MEIKLIDKTVQFAYESQVVLAHLVGWFDFHVVDGILVKSTSALSQRIGFYASKWQSGQVKMDWILIVITFGLFILYFLM
jgi:hypothetical protein